MVEDGEPPLQRGPDGRFIITFPPIKEVPEPPGFICALCGEKKEWYQARYGYQKRFGNPTACICFVCLEATPIRMPDAMTRYDWRDSDIILIARILINLLEKYDGDARRNRNRTAH